MYISSGGIIKFSISFKPALSKGPSKIGLIENSDMSDDIDICFMQVNKEIIFSLKYELLLY